MQKISPDSCPRDPDAPQYPIESVDNALKLLLLLGDTAELRLTDVSRHLGVASSTAHRLLAMLQWRGFVRQDKRTKTYGPGPSLTSITFSIMQRMDVPRLAQPILDELSASLGETVHLGSLEGDLTRFLAVSEPSVAVRVASRIGKSLPAHCTSTGKVLLSELTDEELHHIYPTESLAQVTSHSISRRSELEKHLAKIRKDGYAVNREESEDGVASVAVVVPTYTGHARLALNASVPVHRLPVKEVKAMARNLSEAARRLSDLIG
ncbi:IclR family transcriptional regulator [Arthrobacter sp. B1805]|uniref:IclR family transcriptional regulator n=1 Tax=Arthrobacter sp. B1805 TaxID=2058892 RepID=UPI002157C0CC|nr:IclR family transcriptional regulator [Arthrobacter sp. B1805]